MSRQETYTRVEIYFFDDVGGEKNYKSKYAILYSTSDLKKLSG